MFLCSPWKLSRTEVTLRTSLMSITFLGVHYPILAVTHQINSWRQSVPGMRIGWELLYTLCVARLASRTRGRDPTYAQHYTTPTHCAFRWHSLSVRVNMLGHNGNSQDGRMSAQNGSSHQAIPQGNFCYRQLPRITKKHIKIQTNE